MPDLILMPKSRMINSHVHMQDTSGHTINCMSPQMPPQSPEVVDFSQDLVDICELWGDTVHGYTIADPKYGFWSLDELRQWVRDYAKADVYANQHMGGGGLYCASTSKETIDDLGFRCRRRKNHLVRARMDSLLRETVAKWIGENCHGKTEALMGFPRDGSMENEYMFRDESDATMFVLRWKGHGAMAILE